MRNVLGLILILGGAWLLWSGWTRRSRSFAIAGEDSAATRKPLSDFGAIVRPLVYVALGYLALKASLVYALLDVGGIVSPFDFAGFLFLLAAYAGWLHLRTTRPPAIQRDLAAKIFPEGPVREGFGPNRSRGVLPSARDRVGAGQLTASPAPADEAARCDSRAA